MKTQQLANIVIFSLLLTFILNYYIISTLSFISLKGLGFIIGILLVIYFLFINVSLHFIDFRDTLKLKRINTGDHSYINTPSLKKSIIIFFCILIVISILTYLISGFFK
jgi:hypothetical protein